MTESLDKYLQCVDAVFPATEEKEGGATEEDGQGSTASCSQDDEKTPRGMDCEY